MTDRPTGSARLGIDFGTSHTVAMLGATGQPGRALLFEGAPLLPSAVFAAEDELVVGRFALQQGRRRPGALEPHPKRRIDLDSILLGEREIDTVDVIAAVLTRIRAEAARVAGVLASVTVTVPATWGPTRRQVITEAAERAGLGAVRLIPEPVAAAAYFVRRLDHRIDDGQALVVYDLGAGTFDATVVVRRGDGFETLTQDGRGDLGGLDIDAGIAEHLRHADDIGPDTQGRHYRALLEEIRLAKESLSTYNRADFTVPLSDTDAHLTRGELEDLARPLLAQTVKVTKAVIAAAGLAPEQTAGVFLVGGASRMPLAATMLHRALGTAPTAIEQPELVVAEGGLIAGQDDGAGTDPAPDDGARRSPSEPGIDYRPRPVEPPTTPPTAATTTPDEAPPPPPRRIPGQVVAAAILSAFQALPFIPLWGRALHGGFMEPRLLISTHAIQFLAICASASAVPLLLRRVRWAPTLGVWTSLATLATVLPFMPNSTISNWWFLLGLALASVSIAIITYLSQRRSQEWFATAPRAGDRRARTNRAIVTAAECLGALLGTGLLWMMLREIAPRAFW